MADDIDKRDGIQSQLEVGNDTYILNGCLISDIPILIKLKIFLRLLSYTVVVHITLSLDKKKTIRLLIIHSSFEKE